MGYELLNSKVVAVDVSAQRPVLSRRGSMLGYSGRVVFAPVHGQGAGVGGMLGAAMAGESVPMMASTGDGRALFGARGMHVTVLDLDGASPLLVEADRLLVHDAALQTSVQFLGQGGLRSVVRGMATGQGLFTTQMAGAGQVALLSHGGAFPLQVRPGETVGVDPQAYVASTGQLALDLSAKVGWREAVGRGSGEAFQLHVTGTGTVWVQASERGV